jgi:hypothetical protein
MQTVPSKPGALFWALTSLGRTIGSVGLLIFGVFFTCACSNFLPMAGDGGRVPLDEARAVALARQKVCGAPETPGDRACTVRSVQRSGDTYSVLLERQPPAGGGETVQVMLRDHGMRVEVEDVRSPSSVP